MINIPFPKKEVLEDFFETQKKSIFKRNQQQWCDDTSNMGINEQT